MSDFLPEPVVISAIVVSHNTRAMTLRALQSLSIALESIRSEIWVVDNASTDGSVDAIRSAFPDARIIDNSENEGFGAANNKAMRQARGEFLLLINSDAFASPTAVKDLLACMRANGGAGVVGPRLLNEDGSLQQSCFHFPSPLRAWKENLWLGGPGDYRLWNHDREREVEWVSGACLLVRSEVFRAVGGFDPGYFLYSEETDWQRRIRDGGWTVMFNPAATVVHLGSGGSVTRPAKINPHFFNSLDRYELKHHGRVGLLLFRAAMVIGCTLRTLAWSVMWLLRPARRCVAADKVRIHLILIARQMINWRIFLKDDKLTDPGQNLGSQLKPL